MGDLDNTGRYQSCIQTEAGDKRLKLPANGYFGVTASTGHYGDTHVVYNFIVANLDGADSPEYKMEDVENGDHPAHEVHKQGHHGETHVPVNREDMNSADHSHDNEEHHAPVAPTPTAPQEVDTDDIVRRITLQLSEVAINLRESQRAMSEGIFSMEHNLVEQLPAAGSANTKALRESLGADLHDIEKRFEEVAHEATAAKEAAQQASHEFSTLQHNNAALSAKMDEMLDQMKQMERVCKSKEVQQEQAIANLKSNVAALGESQDKVTSQIVQTVDRVHTNIQETAKSNNSGFWTYFLCAQMLALAAFLYWKRSHDYRREKLL